MDADTAQRSAPGHIWYWIAGILFFGSLVVPVPVALWHIFSGEESVPRLVAPESKTVPLARGTYTVFSDSRAVIDGEIVISQGGLAGLRVSVRGANGREIPVEAASVGSRYNYGGVSGFAVMQFTIPESGNYTIEASYREKSASNRALLSIRKDFVGSLVGTILLTVGLSLAGAFLGVGIFLRTLWARRAVMMSGIVAKLNEVRSYAKQTAGEQGHAAPGAAPSSPVEHQYDRDK